MTRVLLTGAAGFAGSHIAEWIVANTNWNIDAVDCLTYAGHLAGLAHLPESRVRIVHHDFRKPLTGYLLESLAYSTYIIHNGAESHVMRSLKDPGIFVQSNIVGTLNVLEAARTIKPEKFIYVSTDEVLGPSTGRAYEELDRLDPSNPYSATKASGEMLAMAYHKAFGVPVIITRTTNLYGKHQNPEKFVPMTIRKILHGDLVSIHTSGQGSANMRQWLYAGVQASAQLFLLQHGVPGEVYHVSGTERTNLEVAGMIAETLEMPWRYELLDISQQFPGHDHGYLLDDSKLRGLGWKKELNFAGTLRDTVLWYNDNRTWLE